MANKTPTPDKEMNAPMTPINSSFLLPNFSIFIIATNVNAQFTMPTKTAPKKALSTLLIDSLIMFGAKYIIAAIPLKCENMGNNIPIQSGILKKG